jgi:hypothetical protein
VARFPETVAPAIRISLILGRVVNSSGPSGGV